MSYINSKKAYERLDWEIEMYRPIIRSAISNSGDFVLKSCDRMKLKPESEIELLGRTIGLGHSTPNAQYIDGILPNDTCVMQYFAHMNTWLNNTSITNAHKPLVFITLMVPPTFKVKIHNHQVEYGVAKMNDQLRYLRNKISQYIYGAQIIDYIIVYERCASGIIHLHFLHYTSDKYLQSHKDLSHIMGYTKYKQIQINVDERIVHNKEEIIEYLCKIKKNKNI